MVNGTLAFLLGIVIFQWQAELPAIGWLALLVPLLPLLWFVSVRRRAGTRGVALIIAGFLWSWGQAAVILHPHLPDTLEGEDLLLEGTVAALPEADGQRVRFLFDTSRLFYRNQELPPPGRLSLAWYRPYPALQVGQYWRLQARLKRPHGLANPGTFDYEGWLYRHRIRATGYVRSGSDSVLLAADSGDYPLQRIRQGLDSELRRLVGDHPLGGIVAALALGERQGIGPEQWQLLRLTGTNHLVAISGLHIGIVAGLVFWLARRCWRWPEFWPAPKAAAVAALAGAALYAALAGFSVPTQRALLMVAVVMFALIGQRTLQPSRLLAMALLVVVVADPLAVLDAGFWLSFAAVAIILYGMGARLGRGGWWWRWGRVQVLVALGLAPLLVAWFQQASLVSPLANLLAVPWVSLIVVPLVLLAVLLLPWWASGAEMMLMLALRALDGLWWWLAQCAHLLPAQWSAWAVVPWTVVPATLGLLWLLAPRGWPARWLGVLWLLPLALVRPPAPAPGEAWITVLDVGQGLAVLVRTAGHALLFDSGPSFGTEADAGERVVLPALTYYGIGTLDAVVLSHGDSDHAGGAASVFGAVAVERFLSGAEGRYPWRVQEPCRRGQQWAWDGVQFDMLSPSRTGTALKDNDDSCVLRVATAHGSMLLAGDIEAAGEQDLLALVPERLAADVLVVPHHGSKTSSTAPFVTAVAAKDVVFSVGYRNRFGFPHPTVVERYRAAGARMHQTAASGAITVRLGGAGVEVDSWRPQVQRYWSARY